MAVTLPTVPRAPVVQNPRVLLIYSQPKAGKTTVLAQLPNNLIVDMDPLGGADYLEALSVKARSVTDLREIINQLFDSKYDYVTLDPLTDLETLILPLACDLYQKTPMGKNWRPIDPDSGKTDPGMILSLPNGAGYSYLRDAFFKVVHGFSDACQAIGATLILSAHIRDKYISKDGKDVEAVDVNLTGKLRNLTCGWVDAIGYFKRKGNEGYLTFETDDTVICGSRSPHLVDRSILLSKMTENGTIETYWDEIFLPETTQT